MARTIAYLEAAVRSHSNDEQCELLRLARVMGCIHVHSHVTISAQHPLHEFWNDIITYVIINYNDKIICVNVIIIKAITYEASRF